jgi:hypothetical protein
MPSMNVLIYINEGSLIRTLKNIRVQSNISFLIVIARTATPQRVRCNPRRPDIISRMTGHQIRISHDVFARWYIIRDVTGHHGESNLTLLLIVSSPSVSLLLLLSGFPFYQANSIKRERSENWGSVHYAPKWSRYGLMNIKTESRRRVACI